MSMLAQDSALIKALWWEGNTKEYTEWGSSLCSRPEPAEDEGVATVRIQYQEHFSKLVHPLHLKILTQGLNLGAQIILLPKPCISFCPRRLSLAV